MANTPLAEYLRQRPVITRTETAKLLGVTERSVARLVDRGQLAEPAKFGHVPQFSLEDVLRLHVHRCLRTADEAIADDLGDDDDDADPGLFDRAEATG